MPLAGQWPGGKVAENYESAARRRFSKLFAMHCIEMLRACRVRRPAPPGGHVLSLPTRLGLRLNRRLGPEPESRVRVTGLARRGARHSRQVLRQSGKQPEILHLFRIQVIQVIISTSDLQACRA